jgi:hypothetical protein
VVGIPGAEPTAREFESQTELPCFTTGFIPGFSGGPSDRAGAHVQAKISIQGLDLSLVVGGVEFGVCLWVWCAFAAEFRYYSLVF